VDHVTIDAFGKQLAHNLKRLTQTLVRQAKPG
jgi:hypothetical protein